MESRFRPPSPGSRRLNNPPMRASTGTLGFGPPYDNYFPGGPEEFYSTSPEFEPLEPGRPSRRDRREYSASPPRRPLRRATHSAGGDGRAPPIIVGDRRRRSPSGSRPIIHGGLGDRGLSPSALPYDPADEGEYYITPNVSGRRRAGGRVYYPGERSAPGDGITEVIRDKDMDRAHYRTSPMGLGGRRGYHLSGPLVRNLDADGYDDRDAREPMYRRARRQRVGSLDVPSRRERPISMAGLDDYLPPVVEPGPPPPPRGFGGLDRSRSVGRGDKPSRDFTTDPNPFDGPPRGRPVSVHQRKPHTYASSQSPMPGAFPSSLDDEYDGPYSDEFDARGYRIHDDPPIEFNFRGAGDRPRRQGLGSDGRQGPEGWADAPESRAAQERAARERRAMDDEWERHRRRESSAHSRDKRDDHEIRAERERFGSADNRDRRDDLDPRDPRRRSTNPQGQSNLPSNRRPSGPAPIKGILREPREHFPEDPEPIREGALPLREKVPEHLGIPQEARWTKISRKLVNPAALEESRERYEATEKHVIVLRVLAPDEIEQYAARTRKIREERFESEQYERRREGRRRSTIINSPNHTVHQSQQPIPPPPKPQPAQQQSQPPPQQQQQSPPSRGPVIVDPPRRSDTAPISSGGANGGLRPNPDVPGTFLGYRRNPPPIVNSKPVASKPAQG